MSFDPSKPYRCRNGMPAKIVHVFTDGEMLAVKNPGEPDDSYFHVIENGCRYEDDKDPFDLINIPETRWAALLDNGEWTEVFGPLGPGAVIPIKNMPARCIACLPFKDGDGL